MAFITVSDAAGRVLFRRRATEAEIAEAVRAADQADEGAQAALLEVAGERYAALATRSTIERAFAAPPDELDELTELAPPDVVQSLDDTGFVELDRQIQEGELFAPDVVDPWFDDARFRSEESAP